MWKESFQVKKKKQAETRQLLDGSTLWPHQGDIICKENELLSADGCTVWTLKHCLCLWDRTAKVTSSKERESL